MEPLFILILASAAFAAVLAFLAFFRESRSIPRSAFAALMVLLAAESLLDFRLIHAGTPQAAAESILYRFLPSSLVPGLVLAFSLSYSRGNASQFLRRWRIPLLLAFTLPLCLLLAFPKHLIGQVQERVLEQSWFVGLGPAGIALQAIFLLASAIALMNLEQTFRTAVGTMRWRIKYMVLGCGVLFGAQIYTSSQALLFSGIEFSAITLKTSARLLAFSLIAFSLFRSRLAQIDLYPSQEFLYRSLTAIGAGIYLLLVGVFAKLALAFGLNSNFPVVSFLVLLAIVGLAVALLSDRLRQRARLAISRHLRRPVHDYRNIWTLFAARTTALVNRDDLCREVARLLSETFNVLSVTVFLVDDQKHQLVFGASTSLPEEKATALLESTHHVGPLLDWTMGVDPVDMDTSTEPWLLELKKLSPDFFNKGGGRICAPLVASGRLLGFITLTDRVSGIPFSFEDLDLLKCIAGQVAASLLNVKLSATLIRSKELEAFQTMSTFFVHDLKNTALMLSLMLKNLPVHFANPEFREESLRSISKTVDRINDLIARLTSLRQGLQIAPVDIDLNALISSSLAALPDFSPVTIEESFQNLPNVKVDPEQIQKVFTNLILNAKEAVQDQGYIRVETSQSNGWAVLSVSDDGCGISPEFISRSLFRPFQTTKKKGIGIGMYQSKMIVEAHSGRIEVQSALGKGTTFRVLLPITSQNHPTEPRTYVSGFDSVA